MGLLEMIWGQNPVKTTEEFVASTQGLLSAVENARKKRLLEEGMRMVKSLYSGGPLNLGDPEAMAALPEERKQILARIMSMDPDVMSRIVDLMGIYQSVLGNPVPEPVKKRLQNIAGLDAGAAGAPAQIFRELAGAAAEAPHAVMGPAGGLLRTLANMALDGRHQLTVPAGGSIYNVLSGHEEYKNELPERPAPAERPAFPKPPPEMSPNQAYRNITEMIKGKYKDITGDVPPEDRPFKEFVEQIAIGNELYLGGNRAVSAVNSLIREVDKYANVVKRFERKGVPKRSEATPDMIKDYATGMFIKRADPESLERSIIKAGWSPEEARRLLKEAADRVYRLHSLKLRQPQDMLFSGGD